MDSQEKKTSQNLRLVEALDIQHEEEHKVECGRYDSTKDYDYSAFDCGVESINDYLATGMKRDFSASASIAHLATIDNEVIGFFTLSSHAIEKAELKGSLKSSSPYRHVSSILIGKLAVDNDYKGEGMGKRLLGLAIKTAWQSSRDVGTKLVVLHAREGTEQFYIDSGFIRGKLDPSLFIYPLKQYENALRQKLL